MATVTVVWFKRWFLAGSLSKPFQSDMDLAHPNEVLVAWGHDGYIVRLLNSFPNLKYEVVLKDDDNESVAQELLDDLLDSLETQR